MNSLLRQFVLLASLVGLTGSFRMSETARVGGTGGRRTVTMDCGSGSYIVGGTPERTES